VTPSGDVGSIGVFGKHVDTSAMQEKAGLKTTLISAGRFKTEGNPNEPLGDEAREAMQARVDDAYDTFVADVAAGRGVSEGAVRGGYGEGRLLNARRSLAAGLVDGVQTFDATVGSLMADPAGLGATTNSFADAAEEALRAFDAVVGRAEALRALTGPKHAQLEALVERATELLKPRAESGGDLDIESSIIATRTRLLMRKGG
jgi:ClpP class serine protease